MRNAEQRCEREASLGGYAYIELFNSRRGLIFFFLSVCAEHEFTDDQGFFSGIHIDQGDAGNGHSAGLVGSDLPRHAEPGRFHLVGQGVYFSLTYMSQVFFTGLLPHGGTTPLIPEDVEIEGWETRMSTLR